MQQILKKLPAIVFALALIGCDKTIGAGDASAAQSALNLQVEYTQTPLGIDVTQPRFSWQMASLSNKRGQFQTGYQIKVVDPVQKEVWNSGVVKSKTSLHVLYQGEALKSKSRYRWYLTVWDENEVAYTTDSWFETGLLDTKISAWQGAQWIGGDHTSLPLYADYQSLYDLEVSVKIQPNSKKAGVILAADDPRFLNKYKNIYQTQSQEGQSYFKVELDISPLIDASEQHALLNFYRSGYTPQDQPELPVKQFKIKPEVLNPSNRHDAHQLLIHNEYGTLTVQFNGKSDFYVVDKDTPQDPMEQFFPPLVKGAKVTLNPAGVNHDVLSYGMLNSIGFAVAANEVVNFGELKIRHIHQPRNIIAQETPVAGYSGIFANYLAGTNPTLSIKDNSFEVQGGTEGAKVLAKPETTGTPMLRSRADLGKTKISKARLYVTARGIYEFYINGEKISNDFYNPGLTQYNQTHLYQTFDVTSFLKQGDNAFGAILGEGWWSGLLSFGNTWNGFGDRQSLLAMMIVSYEDGTEKVITTNEQDWKFSNQGPYRYGSLQMGEVYDATLEEDFQKWSQVDFDDSKWTPAQVVSLEGSASAGVKPNMMFIPQQLNYDNMQLIGQIGQPARVYQTLTAKSRTEVRPGVFVYDFGQNLVGVPKIHFTGGKAGQVVTLRFAEMLYPDKTESGPNVGMILTENYRAALSQDIYKMKDGDQTYEPRLTSHGFQYLEITGLDQPPPAEQVQALAITSIDKITSRFESSHASVNQLWSNILWSNIDNFLSVPTDCPQRNERMGWSGDLNVFGRTATYVSNSSQFLRRHMLAMRDTQSAEGRFADIAPVGGGFGGILWGVAGITVPWEAYWQYGDTGLLAEHYPSMKSYIQYLRQNINKDNGLLADAGLGDWLGPQNNQLGSAFLATAYHIFALDIMHQVAEIVGENSDAEAYKAELQERTAHFNKTFVNDSKGTVGIVGQGNPFDAMSGELKTVEANTQTSYAVGLALGAFSPELKQVMAEQLAKTVRAENTDDTGIKRPAYSLMTGFIGTAWISSALSENGYSNDAYRLLLNDQYPSWLYPVKQGATTIWERLNGYTVENGFGGNNGMNSFNHYSFGAVGQWLMAHSAGIQRGTPGFQHIKLKPELDPEAEISWVKAEYDSSYGTIKSSWTIEADTFTYQATVPANSTAELILPAALLSDITESGQPLAQADGISELKHSSGLASMVLGSGHYQFKVKRTK